jgi:hypothetical protein
MTAGEAGPVDTWDDEDDVILAPTCRACLSSVDRLLPRPQPDARVPLVAALAAEAIEGHGGAEVHGVPGDQMTVLRKAVRRAVRDRLAYGCQTYVVDDRLFVSCPEAFERVRGTQDHLMAAYLGAVLDGSERPAVDPAEWRIRWQTWG